MAWPTVTDFNISVFSNAGPVAADTSQVTQDGGTVVQRQRINLSDPAQPDAHANVVGRQPLSNEFGPVVWSKNDELIIQILQQMLDEFREFKNTFYGKL